jgi:hypothetical protein
MRIWQRISVFSPYWIILSRYVSMRGRGRRAIHARTRLQAFHRPGSAAPHTLPTQLTEKCTRTS